MTKRILIVDDEQTNISLIKAALKDIDAEFIVGRDGGEGLALAKSEKPDMIILDVMMPKLSGFKVCGLLKSDRNFLNIPIAILSSRAGDDDIEISQKVGANIYMLKPIDQKKLNSEVKKLLKME